MALQLCMTHAYFFFIKFHSCIEITPPFGNAIIVHFKDFFIFFLKEGEKKMWGVENHVVEPA